MPSRRFVAIFLLGPAARGDLELRQELDHRGVDARQCAARMGHRQRLDRRVQRQVAATVPARGDPDQVAIDARAASAGAGVEALVDPGAPQAARERPPRGEDAAGRSAAEDADVTAAARTQQADEVLDHVPANAIFLRPLQCGVSLRIECAGHPRCSDGYAPDGALVAHVRIRADPQGHVGIAGAEDVVGRTRPGRGGREARMQGLDVHHATEARRIGGPAHEDARDVGHRAPDHDARVTGVAAMHVRTSGNEVLLLDVAARGERDRLR